MCSLPVPVFNFHEGPMFQIAPLDKLSGASVLSAMGLGFLLFILIFIDQNIVVSLTNAPENRFMSFEISLFLKHLTTHKWLHHNDYSN